MLFWERYVPPEDAGRVRAAIEAVVDGGEPAFHEGALAHAGRARSSTSVVVQPAADDRERARSSSSRRRT